MRSIFVIFFIVVGVSSEKIRYDNYQVYRLKVDNEAQLELLNSLERNKDKIAEFWKSPKNVGSEADILVAPEKLDEFLKFVHRGKFNSKLMINNVQTLIDEGGTPTKRTSSFGWDSYHTLSEIYNWIDSLIKTYPKQIKPFDIGKSYEGRKIRGIKISYKKGNPGVFLEANIHACEWIASSVATYIINELLTSKDYKIRRIAENVDWYIVPVFNVDGFIYSHETDRLWRKNRNPYSDVCPGVDLNRNFDVYWMSNGGASSDPCSHVYAGPKPFSEPEAQAMANFVEKIKDRISVYLAFHSYGQMVLSPYGHAKDVFPPYFDEMQLIAEQVSGALSQQFNTSYIYGSTATTLYIASGMSPDWACYNGYADIGYTLEFRDKGEHGFVLPPSKILPNCREAMDGIITLVEQAKRLNFL